MRMQVISIIEHYGSLIEPKEDINITEARDIIGGSHTKMEIVGNSYLYGYMRGRASAGSKMVPVLNIRQMSDEEWTELATKNKLEREGLA